jgi:hypothetical protein
MLGVHYAGLSDMNRASQKVLLAHIAGAPGKLNSFGNDPITESVSVIEASLCSALFCVFMARVQYNLEQRVFIYDCYVKTNSYKSCTRKFCYKFPETCPSGDTISKSVKKLRTHGILIDRKLLKVVVFYLRKNFMTSFTDKKILQVYLCSN